MTDDCPRDLTFPWQPYFDKHLFPNFNQVCGLWCRGLKAEASGGYRGMLPREILKIRSSEMRFLGF